MKKCEKCGAEMSDAAVSCPTCGSQATLIKAEVSDKPLTRAGICGVVTLFAVWLFFLFPIPCDALIILYAISITGIVFGIKELQNREALSGLILSVAGLVLVIGATVTIMIIYNKAQDAAESIRTLCLIKSAERNTVIEINMEGSSSHCFSKLIQAFSRIWEEATANDLFTTTTSSSIIRVEEGFLLTAFRWVGVLAVFPAVWIIASLICVIIGNRRYYNTGCKTLLTVSVVSLILSVYLSLFYNIYSSLMPVEGLKYILEADTVVTESLAGDTESDTGYGETESETETALEPAT